MAELLFCLLLAWVRVQELPRDRNKEAKLPGASCSPRGLGVCFKQIQPLLLPHNLHQHWLCMILAERIPPACGPWGAKSELLCPRSGCYGA